jgi:predicted  nucleic acid-binding Zn-ribbon protein
VLWRQEREHQHTVDKLTQQAERLNNEIQIEEQHLADLEQRIQEQEEKVGSFGEQSYSWLAY